MSDQNQNDDDIEIAYIRTLIFPTILKGVFRFTVDCPYCKGVHSHGAGTNFSEISNYIGNKQAPCCLRSYDISKTRKERTRELKWKNKEYIREYHRNYSRTVRAKKQKKREEIDCQNQDQPQLPSSESQSCPQAN